MISEFLPSSVECTIVLACAVYLRMKDRYEMNTDETLLRPFQSNLEIFVSVSLSVPGLFVCTTKVNTLQRTDIEVNATKGKKCPKTVKIADRDLAVIIAATILIRTHVKHLGFPG